MGLVCFVWLQLLSLSKQTFPRGFKARCRRRRRRRRSLFPFKFPKAICMYIYSNLKEFPKFTHNNEELTKKIERVSSVVGSQINKFVAAAEIVINPTMQKSTTRQPQLAPSLTNPLHVRNWLLHMRMSLAGWCSR